MCHKYQVVKQSKNRVYLEYNNPDEWAADHPMTAVLPCYIELDKDNPNVVLEILDVKKDNWNGEGWQSFLPVLDYDYSKNPN